MLVRITFGSRRGEVIDFLPHEAHAMLADGRATLPNATPSVPRDVSIVEVQVAARSDRGMPATKPRRQR